MTSAPVQTLTDEETPLLQSQQGKTSRSPLPWFQICIILFLQLAEPLTSQVIYPFAPQLIREIGITNGDEAKVGYYVGTLQSLFFLTQAFTVLHWSRTSDRIGRKPVILVGLFGLSVSMYCFGLSRTFWGLVLSRSLNGALNGNIGVIKSMLAEICDPTNISQAYAFMPISWSTGSTLGPIIGGALSHPAEQFPELFGNSDFLKKYPYFLPCSIPATFSILAWLVTFIYLKETVASPLTVSQFFGSKKKQTGLPKTVVRLQETHDFLPSKTIISDSAETEKPKTLRELLTRRVVIAGANYALLSLVDISFRAIHPVFLSTPIPLGGLGLPPSAIGNLLSLYGVVNGIFQVFFFAKIHDKWGSKRVFTAGIASALLLFALFPVMSFYAKLEGLGPTVWLLAYFQSVMSILLSLSYGCIFIYISGAAPNRASLGAVNGLCQMTVSVMRAVGPAAANSMFSLSIEHQYLGGWLVYYMLMVVVGGSIMVAGMLPQQVWAA